MDKYRQAAEKRLTTKVHPDMLAKEALVKAEFSSREREAFFNDAFGELMVDYTMQLYKTDPHESKTREFIYSCILALGDVKSKLIQYETYGKNIPIIEDNDNERN